MGGCRCTYRNCTVKTDGKTHMFHYPVFEKVRCHQWLVNAHRLDFFDLRVSQLKNRVVCQHHFKEECFMNYKKDKLIFDAIPTEDGPFCDASKFIEPSQHIIKSYPTLILLEDIENEVVFNDKKANFSLKYGDFLTNGELIDSSSRYNSNNINLSKQNNITNTIFKSNKETFNPQTALYKPHFTKLSLPTKTVNIQNPQPMLIVPPYTDLSIEIAAGKEANQEQCTINIYPPDIPNSNPTHSCRLIKPNSMEPQNDSVPVIKKEPKIKILSEEKIEGPIPVLGRLEKVSPSTTINIPDKNRENIIRKKCLKEPAKTLDKVKVMEVLDVEYEPQLKSDTSTAISQIKAETKINDSSTSLQTKMCKNKNKLTPERTAAIEEKRKFNMRMKDILETCLDKLDEPMKTEEKNPPPAKSTSKSLIKQPNLQVSANRLANEETLPNVQEYTIAYLDERMKSMERVLLNKIEQNSQKIMELTESFGNKKEPVQKKNVNAQTNDSEQQYKRFLYEEISKYISPNSKSLIYEELFINKFALVNRSPQRIKRRKLI